MSCIATNQDPTKYPIKVFVPKIVAPDFSRDIADEDSKLMRDISVCIGKLALTMPDKKAPELDGMIARLQFEKPGIFDGRPVAVSVEHSCASTCMQMTVSRTTTT